MGRLELPWNSHDPLNSGPCIDVVVMNSQDIVAAWRADGLEIPAPITLRALIDTGASVSVISKVFARNCKLLVTSPGTEINALGATHKCGEHAGSISFPGTNLKSFDSMRIVSAEFVGERHYACLIGRDILRRWKITFDGPGGRLTIED